MALTRRLACPFSWQVRTLELRSSDPCTDVFFVSQVCGVRTCNFSPAGDVLGSVGAPQRPGVQRSWEARLRAYARALACVPACSISTHPQWQGEAKTGLWGGGGVCACLPSRMNCPGEGGGGACGHPVPNGWRNPLHALALGAASSLAALPSCAALALQAWKEDCFVYGTPGLWRVFAKLTWVRACAFGCLNPCPSPSPHSRSHRPAWSSAGRPGPGGHRHAHHCQQGISVVIRVAHGSSSWSSASCARDRIRAAAAALVDLPKLEFGGGGAVRPVVSVRTLCRAPGVCMPRRSQAAVPPAPVRALLPARTEPSPAPALAPPPPRVHAPPPPTRHGCSPPFCPAFTTTDKVQHK
jgi:hypothetical protein